MSVVLPVKKTNAVRYLDELGINYQLFSAIVDESDLSAVTLAHRLGIPPEQMFKTLVAKGSGQSGQNALMACIPGPAELDLKKLAAASGHKSAAMVPLREVQPLTGYVRGGCSPLGAKKAHPVFLDESALLWDAIYISAGLRGVQILLAPDDLVRATDAVYTGLCKA